MAEKKELIKDNLLIREELTKMQVKNMDMQAKIVHLFSALEQFNIQFD